jgi:hypothetical protein
MSPVLVSPYDPRWPARASVLIAALLGAAAPGVESYSDVKGPVVDLVIAVAKPWALHTGWNTEPTGA